MFGFMANKTSKQTQIAYANSLALQWDRSCVYRSISLANNPLKWDHQTSRILFFVFQSSFSYSVLGFAGFIWGFPQFHSQWSAIGFALLRIGQDLCPSQDSFMAVPETLDHADIFVKHSSMILFAFVFQLIVMVPVLAVKHHPVTDQHRRHRPLTAATSRFVLSQESLRILNNP